MDFRVLFSPLLSLFDLLFLPSHLCFAAVLALSDVCFLWSHVASMFVLYSLGL